MRSCVLVLAWLGAVLFLSLRGSVKAAQTNSVRGLINPRLTRNLVVPDNPNAAGIRYTRNRGAAASIGSRPVESLVLLDEIESAVDEDKRQFDDYGHMRFGKRGPAFDDYGHMRFGRSD